MANWLERARREIQKTSSRPTAKTDETLVLAVSAVPQPWESGISRASTASRGSIHNEPDAGAEEIGPALADAYRRFWSLPESEPIEVFQAVRREIERLESKADPQTAWRTLRATATAFHAESGICPFCRQAGDLHLPAERIESELSLVVAA